MILVNEVIVAVIASGLLMIVETGISLIIGGLISIGFMYGFACIG